MRETARRWLHERAGLWAAAALAAGAWLLLGQAAWAGAPVAGVLLTGALALAAWLAWDAALRMRLRRGYGAGVVEVREGRVGFFGPDRGGVVDLDSLRTIAVEPGRRGAFWVLHPAEGDALRIPMAAVGAEVLLDAFAALPGFVPGRVSRAVQGRQPRPVWHRGELGDKPVETLALASTDAGSYISPHRR